MSARWAEISEEPDEIRYAALSAALRSSGIDNQVEFIKTDSDGFAQELNRAKERFGQLRVGGRLRGLVPAMVDSLPSTLISLKMADAFVPVGEGRRVWWPRCYLEEGFRGALIAEVGEFDISGAVFILGATLEARAAVAALARLGFGRFSIADMDDGRCRSFVEDLSRSFFNLRLQSLPRTQITQIPNVHSMAINTLAVGRDDGTHGELFYFNFLKTGGVWLDLSLRPANADLLAEARSVGAVIARGAAVAAWTDVAWAVDAFQTRLDAQTLCQSYVEAFGKPVG